MKYLYETSNSVGDTTRVVAHSRSTSNPENSIITFELEYWRAIHPELLTHRYFSRNAMSSRAVSLKNMESLVRSQETSPIYWGLDQRGMSASNEHEDPSLCVEAWDRGRERALKTFNELKDLGLHKQIVNRPLDPYQRIKVVLTTTELNNFFWLRLGDDVEPNMQSLASMMKDCVDNSPVEELHDDEWHTPYVQHERDFEGNLVYLVEGLPVTTKEALAISSSCCAQVSFRTIDNSYNKATSVYKKLGVGSDKMHASPFEHQAKPIKDCRVDFNNPVITPEEGVTHLDMSGNYWSGNFKGFIQHRQLIANNAKNG